MNIMGEDTTLHPHKSDQKTYRKPLSCRSALYVDISTPQHSYIFLRKFTIKMSELSVFYAKVFISGKKYVHKFYYQFCPQISILK